MSELKHTWPLSYRTALLEPFRLLQQDPEEIDFLKNQPKGAVLAWKNIWSEFPERTDALGEHTLRH